MLEHRKKWLQGVALLLAVFFMLSLAGCQSGGGWKETANRANV